MFLVVGAKPLNMPPPPVGLFPRGRSGEFEPLDRLRQKMPPVHAVRQSLPSPAGRCRSCGMQGYRGVGRKPARVLGAGLLVVGVGGAKAPDAGVSGGKALNFDATGNAVVAHPIRAGLVRCREAERLSSGVQRARNAPARVGCNGRAKRLPCQVERRYRRGEWWHHSQLAVR